MANTAKEFQYEIVCKKSSLNTNADTWSRVFQLETVKEENEITEKPHPDSK